MSDELSRVKGIGPKTAELFIEAGIISIKAISESTPEDLAEIKGVGVISANAIIRSAKQVINAEKGIEKVLDFIKDEFIHACPKCGGKMERKNIILGPERHLSVNQCKTCKFYLPV